MHFPLDNSFLICYHIVALIIPSNQEFCRFVTKMYMKNIKKSQLNEYIPLKHIDIEKLRQDIDAQRLQYQHEAFAKLLAVERATFTMKLLGTRKWKLSELLLVASRLGKDYREYLKG